MTFLLVFGAAACGVMSVALMSPGLGVAGLAFLVASLINDGITARRRHLSNQPRRHRP